MNSCNHTGCSAIGTDLVDGVGYSPTPLASGHCLVGERKRDRPTGAEQRLVAQTGSARLEGTMDRTVLRRTESEVYSCLRQSDRNRLVQTRLLGGVGAGRSILPTIR